MSKKARSARGEVVDFDLIAIREQLASKPPTIDVDIRRQYVDAKEKAKQIIKAIPITTTTGKKESATPEQKSITSKEKTDGSTTTS